nr:PREDICTED: ubiquitin domain-containing protein 1-like isoform X1 [Nicotiana tabacum]
MVWKGGLRAVTHFIIAKLSKRTYETVKKIRKPKPWKHSEPITRAQLVQMRDEFWDTAPHYGGRKEIWDALRAAAEADVSLAQAFVDSAGIIVQVPDLTICYDERGAKYELPKYVLSEPTNLIGEN